MARGSTTTLHDAAGNVRGVRIKYDLHPHPGTGKRRQRNDTLHRRPGETVASLRKRADAALADALTRVESGAVLPDRATTLADYLTKTWLPHYRATVRPSSYWQREWAVRCWIVPRLGAVKLANLRALAIQDAYAGMLADGIATASLGAVHTALGSALRQAVKWELLPRNPCAGVDPPAIRPTRQTRALSPDEASALLAVARATGDAYTDLYELAILTQLRLGELLALRWDDVDLPASILRVEQTLTRDADRKPTIGPPKTDGSRRLVWLDEVARELLARQRTRQAARKTAAGSKWTETGLVFDRGDGQRVSDSVVRQTLARTAERAAIGHVSPHMLRHTGLTWMGKAGTNPLVAGKRAGHTSLAMTHHYTHAAVDWQSESAAAVARILHGVGATPSDTDASLSHREDDV